MGEDEFQREKFSEIEVVTFLSNLEVKDEAYEVCILAIFSATSEQALLKSGQSLSPVVSDLGRGKAGLWVRGTEVVVGTGSTLYINSKDKWRWRSEERREGGKGATARSRCIRWTVYHERMDRR